MFQPYLKYKESDADWLDQIPDHWRMVDSRRHFLQRKQRAEVGDQQLTASQKFGVIPQEVFMRLEGHKVVQVITGADILKHVEPDDFVISMRSFQGGLEHSPYRGCISSAYVMLIPTSEVVPAFFKHLFKSSRYIQALQATSNLVRDGQAMRYANFAQVPLPVLPRTEQKTIADFLDRETARIDQLIEKKERLVFLLSQRFDETVRQVVTMGTPRSMHPLVDSSVDYLGDVPQHWSVERTGWRYTVQLGKMLDSAKQTGKHARPYLRVADVQWDAINTDDLPVMDFTPSDRKRYELVAGDLLVNEGGSYVGRSAIWEDETECYYQKALHRLRPLRADRDTSEFFLWVMWFATKYGVFVANGNQTTIDHLTAEALRRYRFAFPPHDEQLELARYLRNERKRSHKTEGVVALSTSRLREFRSALITAAVTGQIDVTTWGKQGSTDRRLDQIEEEMSA